MKIGDIVRGLPESSQRYDITTKKMTRGLIVDANEGKIKVKVLDHGEGSSGSYWVDPK